MNESLNMSEKKYIQSAMLLDWIGQAPIVINRAFIDLTGNVLAALWLSYAIEKIKDHGTADEPLKAAVIAVSASECEKDTGITRAQQQTCRKTLAALGLLTEEGGQGKVPSFRIHLDTMMKMLEAQVKPMADALQRADQLAPGLSAHDAKAQLGLDWWNGLNDQQRKHWMAMAGNTGIAADAWAAYQNSQIQVS